MVEALAPDRTAEHNWLMAARAVGSLYLGLLAAVLVLMTRRLGADDRSAVALAVLAATSPLMLLQFSTVNNDALGVLLTTVAVLSWLLLERTRPWVRLIVSYGIALLAVSAKETALVALLCVVVLHASHLWHAGHRIRSLVAPLGAGIAVIGAYSVARSLWPALTGELPGNDLQADFITSIQGQPSWLDVTGSTLRLGRQRPLRTNQPPGLGWVQLLRGRCWQPPPSAVRSPGQRRYGSPARGREAPGL